MLDNLIKIVLEIFVICKLFIDKKKIIYIDVG